MRREYESSRKKSAGRNNPADLSIIRNISPKRQSREKRLAHLEVLDRPSPRAELKLSFDA